MTRPAFVRVVVLASAVAVAGATTACSSLVEPPTAQSSSAGGPPKITAEPTPLPRPGTTAAAPRPAAPEQGAQEEKVGASHVLVQWKGSMRAAPSVTRTKEEARKRIEEVLAKARAGADFGELAKEYSDEPGAGARGGSLGTFTRGAMVKPFADAAFALKPGQVSGVVETDFGFHVIKRTQ